MNAGRILTADPTLSTSSLRRTRRAALEVTVNCRQNAQWLLLMGSSFTIAAYLQYVRGYDAIQSGVIFSAATAGVLLSSLG